MRRHAATVGLCLSVLAAGCSHLGALDFVKADNSGVAGGRVSVVSIQDGVPRSLAAIPLALFQDPDLRSSLQSHCGMPFDDKSFKAAGVALAPILAALAQVAVGLHFDRQKQRIEDIVAAAQASYGATTELTPQQLVKTNCLLVSRYAEQAGRVDKVGLQLLLRVQRIEGGFPAATEALVVRPVFLRARDAVAATRKADPASIGVAVAVSLKALGRRQGDDLPHLLPVGEVVVSVADVQLAGAALCMDLSCQRSDWLPFPLDRGLLSVSVALAEQGQTGFNDKLVLAEIAALKEALGPAVAEVVKTKLGD